MDDETPIWPINHSIQHLCKSDSQCIDPLYPDTSVAKCGNVFTDYQLDPRVVDRTDELELIFYDIVNFNNIGNAGVLIFQMVTLEGWTDILYNYMDSSNSFLAAVFFVSIVIFGAFVLMNLILAQIMHSFIT